VKTNTISCIYRFDFLSTGWFYIGSTKNYQQRIRQHYTGMKNQLHKNPKVQNVYNKYKLKPAFRIIEFCSEKKLQERENYWLDLAEPNLNILLKSDSSVRKLKLPLVGKTIKLKNLETGFIENIAFDDLESFIRDNITRYGDFKKVLIQQRFSSEGWSLFSIDGVLSTRVNKRETEEYKDRLCKRIKSMRVLAQKPEAILKIVEKNSKKFHIIEPSGLEYCIKNLSAFCREHNLDNSTMIKVAKGKVSNHKGYLCNYIEDS